MEVTGRCNLSCPICFASSNETGYEPDFDVIRGMFETLFHAAGPCPVQLSGGEPTVRDDLPRIVKLGQEIGFQHMMVNTNGVRIAESKEYLAKLKKSGVDTIYLQFDGVTDNVNSHMRNRQLLQTKLRAIKNCAEVGIGVVLVPTLVPKVNDHQLGDIIQLAKKWMPTVRGIHFQPISYFGRYPETPLDEDRITIPDVLRAIETQTKGEIKSQDFVPRRRKESFCAFAGLFVLMGDGRLLPTTHYARSQNVIGGLGYFKESPAKHVHRFLSLHWKLVSESRSICQCETGSWQEFYERAKMHCLSISCMPFQDAWSIDLERLQNCCTHVISPDRRLVPLCAYYLTSATGRRLHQAEEVTRHVS